MAHEESDQGTDGSCETEAESCSIGPGGEESKARGGGHGRKMQQALLSRLLILEPLEANDG